MRLGDQIYDITAWNLPMLFDVDVLTSGAGDRRQVDAGRAGRTTPPAALPPAKVAYLLPWSSGAAATVADAMAEGIKVRQASEPFTIAGRSYPGRHGHRPHVRQR